MSKMNRNLRMGKAITGHKNVTPLKGTDHDYEITTNPEGTVATIKTTEGTEIGLAGASNLKNLVKRCRQALVSLGVRFPIAKDADVAIVVEEQRIEFSDVPDAGTWTLEWNGEETDVLAHDATNSDVEDALRELPGLEQVEVIGDYSNDFIVTFTGVIGDAAMLVEASNSLEENSNPITMTITEETKGQ